MERIDKVSFTRLSKLMTPNLIVNRFLTLVVAELLISGNCVLAQIKPDRTLGTESSAATPKVINGIPTDQIDGGALRGGNLFHSFEQFSVLTGHVAYFNNPLSIQNIITRVTGDSISSIDGSLKANGTANLLLINPHGISFGRNASLNIGGSFLGSTASSLNFADGTQFNATASKTKPLLTINVPIGLQLGTNPGAIRVQGTGHNLTTPAFLYSPILGAGGSSDGLRVLPGKTLALVGGNIAIEGGKLTAEGGRIDLGSVGGHERVSLNPTVSGWTLSYEHVHSFRNIQLLQRALVDTSGSPSGSSQMVGEQISLSDGSLELNQNQGSQPGGDINVKAFDSLKLSGTTPEGNLNSGFQNETLGGNTGNITVSAKHLVIQDGAAINTKTFTGSDAGNIILNVTDSIQIIGFSPAFPATDSGIGTYTLDSGRAGNIIINTGSFLGLNGGTVLSGTFGIGKGGDLIVNANKSIQLVGFNPFVAISPSELAVGSFNAGNTGNLVINTPSLLLQNGGNINSYTFSTGNAGDVFIHASFVDITRAGTNGPLYNLVFGISSFAAVTSSTLQQLLKIPPVLSGASGNITITTKQLTVADGGIINVTNAGTGPAGRITVNANSIFLNNSAVIAAATTSGNGGDIFLQAGSFQLRHNSRIDATSSEPQAFPVLVLPTNLPITESGNGGNITIGTDALALLEGSNIKANAFMGSGGKIQINTQALFRSPDSSITARSQRGPQFNGIVQINIPAEINFARAAGTPITPPQSPQVASVCSGQSSSIDISKN